jgi:membrane-bound ClpP family serine protease
MQAFISAFQALVSNIGVFTGICLIVGIALIIVEMFVPGFGIPGITGGILLVVSVFFTTKSILEVLIMLIIILLILGSSLMVVVNMAKKGKLSKGIILDSSMKGEDDSIGMKDMEYFKGKKGVSLTNLRPAGTIDLDGVKLDVVTDGNFIDKGKSVEIVRVDGIRIVVREIE